MTSRANTLQRHSRGAIFMHWFNAVLFILLLLSGLGMLRNPEMSVLGQWWPKFLDDTLGPAALLCGHIALGLAWLGGVSLYAITHAKKDVLPFLREVFRLKPAQDISWCLRKGLRLTIGPKGMKKLGLDPELPPQGFYNAGQKLAAIAVVFCGLGLAVSGLPLWLNTLGALGEGLIQWCMFLHLLCAGVMCVVLPIHIYMAALAPGEGPALRSMFTGTVPEAYARHHNPLWHAEVACHEAESPSPKKSNAEE